LVYQIYLLTAGKYTSSTIYTCHHFHTIQTIKEIAMPRQISAEIGPRPQHLSLLGHPLFSLCSENQRANDVEPGDSSPFPHLAHEPLENYLSSLQRQIQHDSIPGSRKPVHMGTSVFAPPQSGTGDAAAKLRRVRMVRMKMVKRLL
jgi:hypothetical protein